MATTTTKRTTPARPSTATTRAKSQAKATAAATTTAAQRGERTVRTMVTDGVYAAVGATDTAVAALRTLPKRAKELVNEGPVRVRELTKDVEEGFDTLAVRGRKVVTEIRKAEPMKDAVAQTKAAKRLVKSAATSVRRAVADSTDAVETAAEKIGS